MFQTFAFCGLCCCCLVGVFADPDEVKSVSVTEGDSVTLNTRLTEIQKDDQILWKFGPNRSLIAKISRETGVFNTYDGPDEKFRNRLELDHQTGSLTITNINTTDAGLYEVTIKISRSEHKYRFDVSLSNGVFADADEVKSVSVTEGDSVTLNTSLTEIQKDDQILWKFGQNRSLIAKISRETGVFNTYDGPDEKFRNRLELNNQTGSLTITNINTTDAGLYEVTIKISRSEDKYRFNVSLSNDCTCCCHDTEALTRLVISAVVGVASVFIVVYDITSRKGEK
ncbi:uncharacterized protein LOC113040287 [Carassius auratus]|uniref:Uncharacterized protein LOC113040287 n=1 Tax=Carassius auratus TaxID=7957 RepID=A0A6P6J985_CARAU|nr:uncharacterized protein LOC113040287 [Carassius auratus]